MSTSHLPPSEPLFVGRYFHGSGPSLNAATQKPNGTENLVATNAMAPQNLLIPVGTTVTFVNPADNANAHGAVSFFEYEFDTGVLMPGQSFGHAFTKAGEYFYNDPIFPQSTGKIVVQ